LASPRAFIFNQDPEEFDTGAVSFGSFSKVSARERDAGHFDREICIELGKQGYGSSETWRNRALKVGRLAQSVEPAVVGEDHQK
jgi:hypothetical protein